MLVEVDAQAPKFPPLDEANESFRAFRQEALAALARKDTAFLYAMLSPVIKNSFGGDDGVSGFKQVWSMDDPRTTMWVTLARVLQMGGRQSSDSTFVVPYVYAFWPDSLDAFSYVAVTDSYAVVREQPDVSAPALGAASHSIVRALEWSQFPSARLPADSTWVRVQFPGGVAGWMSGTDVYSPVSYRAMFMRQNGRWIMILLVAGD